MLSAKQVCRRSAGAFALVAAVICGASAGVAGGGYEVYCDDDGTIPNEVFTDVREVVDVVDARTVVLGGGVVVRVPADPSSLAFRCRAPGSGYIAFDRVRTGDLVDVVGSLRTDGSILAYRMLLAEADAPSADPVAAGFAAEVVYGDDGSGGSVPASLSIGDETFAVDPGATVAGASLPSYISSPLLDGDAVFVTYREQTDGSKLAIDVRVRPSGEDTRVEGIVESVDEDTMEFAVAGVDCRQLENAVIRIDELLEGPPVQVGRRVVVEGILRDGIVLGYELTVDAEVSASRLAKRAGRLRAAGHVDAAAEGSVTVSGFELPVAAGRAGRPLRAAAVGDVVRVDARIRRGVVQRARLISRRATAE